MHETLVSGTARKADLPGWQAAGKTGTTEDFRDAWFVGYTSRLVTGVWLGNDDNAPTKKAVGGGLPVEIWSRFMRAAHAGMAPAALPGLDTGWSAPSLQPGFSAALGPAAGNRSDQLSRQQSDAGGLDTWLLDKLFGRH
jgi:penicillin-binding protein 1A